MPAEEGERGLMGGVEGFECAGCRDQLAEGEVCDRLLRCPCGLVCCRLPAHLAPPLPVGPWAVVGTEGPPGWSSRGHCYARRRRGVNQRKGGAGRSMVQRCRNPGSC